MSMLATAQTTVDTASKKVVRLDEVIISVSKSEEKRSNIPYAIEVIKSREIELGNPQTAADVLQNTGAVFVQKSQMGGGSPVLRGFEASRVLIVVDGVRMNNAIYRAGHLQDVITLDHSMIEQTEVIFGPSSVMYGSDALGGVMHFYTKKPMLSDDKMIVKGNSYVRWSSANNERTGHFDINFGWQKLASLTSFTYSKFGDLRAGANRDPVYDSLFTRDFYVERINGIDSILKNENPDIQKFSAYSQYDLFQKLMFTQNDKIQHTLNLQFSNSSDIPRYDRLTEMSGGNPRFAEWHYGPQKRMLASLNTRITQPGKWADRLDIVIGAQDIAQQRVNRRFRNDHRTIQDEKVQVYSLNADLLRILNPTNDLRYGAELTHNEVQSVARKINITTLAESPAETRYPDGGSSMSSGAAYVSHRWRPSDKFILSDGIRFSASTLQASFTDTTFFPFPFSDITQKSSNVSGNLGLVIKPASGWKFSVLASSGFRTPNVDDLGKIFDSSPGILIIANPGLKPEKAYNAELGIEKIYADMIRISVTGWHTWLEDAMVVRNFSYNGQDSVLFNGVMSRVQAVQNADKGYIQGITGSFLADFNEQFSFSSTATFTHGRYKDTEKDTLVPLDHIPPAFGKTALIYRKNKVEAECYALYNAWKKLKDYSPSGEDNLQYATPYGMPSWITLNLKAAWKVRSYLTLQAGVENVLDTHYRNFASGISAPGRNVIVALRGRF